jgi:hypothetical protein
MTTTTLSPTAQVAASREPAESLIVRISRWFGTTRLDERTSYLCESSDHADYERRLQHWEEHERRCARFGMLGC